MELIPVFMGSWYSLFWSKIAYSECKLTACCLDTVDHNYILPEPHECSPHTCLHVFLCDAFYLCGGLIPAKFSDLNFVGIFHRSPPVIFTANFIVLYFSTLMVMCSVFSGATALFAVFSKLPHQSGKMVLC